MERLGVLKIILQLAYIFFLILHIAVEDTQVYNERTCKGWIPGLFLVSILLRTHKEEKEKPSDKKQRVPWENDSTKEEEKRGWMDSRDLSWKATHPGLMCLPPKRHAKMLLSILVHNFIFSVPHVTLLFLPARRYGFL